LKSILIVVFPPCSSYWELNDDGTELTLTPKNQSENGSIGVAAGKSKTFKGISCFRNRIAECRLFYPLRRQICRQKQTAVLPGRLLFRSKAHLPLFLQLMWIRNLFAVQWSPAMPQTCPQLELQRFPRMHRVVSVSMFFWSRQPANKASIASERSAQINFFIYAKSGYT